MSTALGELQAKTLFEHLKEIYPGIYQDGQLRTLQRKVKIWRATEGPVKEVFFPQNHHPGVLGESDFTHMNDLKITIKGEPFNHLFYHFVLPYSNWETGNICFSESFESLSEGLQGALWKLGGSPQKHKSDRLSAAINKDCSREMFTDRYKGLLGHYRISGMATNACKANENGDVEQSHNRFKKTVDQALMLRGSRDFEDKKEYELFALSIMNKKNLGRQKRFNEELPFLQKLPASKMDDRKTVSLKVGKSSTINILRNTYSVNSRFIGERINIIISSEFLEVWYGQKQYDRMPRLRGESRSSINYRHIIDWLMRKPGAFENYRHRDDLFPSTTFRIAYDLLKEKYPDTANKKYLAILNLAAKESESEVEQSLKLLLEKNIVPVSEKISEYTALKNKSPLRIEPEVITVSLSVYDSMLSGSAI